MFAQNDAGLCVTSVDYYIGYLVCYSYVHVFPCHGGVALHGHSAKYNITYVWLAAFKLVKYSPGGEAVGVVTVIEIFAICA